MGAGIPQTVCISGHVHTDEGASLKGYCPVDKSTLEQVHLETSIAMDSAMPENMEVCMAVVSVLQQVVMGQWSQELYSMTCMGLLGSNSERSRILSMSL